VSPPYTKIAAFRERMDWSVSWYSPAGSDFNYDFHATVDERVAPVQIFGRHAADLARAGMPWTESMRGDWPGISTFLHVDGEVFHTYSTFSRGIEEFHNGLSLPGSDRARPAGGGGGAQRLSDAARACGRGS
jgi:predicted dithiol-disulfide oxidoreductase (DUF899 family)